MAEESSFQGLNLKNSLAVVEAVGMWESRGDFQGGGETRRVRPHRHFHRPCCRELHFSPKLAGRNCSKSLRLAWATICHCVTSSTALMWYTPLAAGRSPWCTVSTRRLPGWPCGSGRRRSPIVTAVGLVLT